MRWCALVALLGCHASNGAAPDAASCPVDTCDGTCTDLSNDPANCGACGSACASGEVCTDSACVQACDATMLDAKISDPWGLQWDGLDRTALAYDAAAAQCSAFGARLPTATELYRVSATQSGAVGQSFNTALLWTQVPVDKLNQVTAKLADGATASTPAATATAFRCVCPAALPKTFTGVHCNGDVGSECFPVGAYNIDAKDRPALRRSSALWECANEHAHVAESELLIAGIRAGLPGIGAPVATADSATYNTLAAFTWTGPAFTITATSLTNPALTTATKFRCAAGRSSLEPNRGEPMDSAAATWAAAHDACVVRGGHLPRAAELGELIQAGLPNGSNTALWTSDQAGYNSTSTSFYAEVLNWSALDTRFSFQYTGVAATQTATWLPKQSTAPYRCIFYPLDPGYVAPTACNGGCFMVTASTTSMWFDTMNRPAATVANAIADCAAADGHLASERDLTEAIRAGLPNGAGTATYVLTSDFATGVMATIVRWTGVDTAFTDQYPTYMTWSDPGTARPYRCTWTNELR